MKNLTVVFLLLFLSANTYSQQAFFNLSGYLTDEASKEVIINATVTLDGKKSVSTNNYGFFSFKVPQGEHNLLLSAVGHQVVDTFMNITRDTIINIDIPKLITTYSEIVIAGKRKDLNVVSAQMGEINLSEKQIKSVPAFLGEVDLIKVYQYTPGVSNAGEGNAGFYVRGGGPDQNLILLDEATVYNVSHLLGLFSVFNADAVNSTSLIKGGMPAQYGGRLSSVLNITTKEGNMKDYKFGGGIGILSSRLSAEGPIAKDKASFIVTGRRSYLDLITQFLSSDDGEPIPNVVFYDFNAKANYIISKKDRVFVSGYFGRDVINIDNESDGNRLVADVGWGNQTLTARWNHVYSKNLFSNLTAYFNRYDFGLSASFNDITFGYNSGITDYGIKNDYEWFASYNHKVRFGLQYTYHIFTPTTISSTIDGVDISPAKPDSKFSNEFAAYVQDEWDITDKILLNVGLRYSAFQQIGPYDLVDPNEITRDGTFRVIEEFDNLENVVFYHALEPRFTLRYLFDNQSSLKIGLTKNNQYIHLVTATGTLLPTDVWVPSSTRVKPQVSYQAALGYFRNFKNNTYETSVEVYYKHLLNQIEFREGYISDDTRDPEFDFVYGMGRAYGIEFFIKKNKGKLTGWIGYTLAYATRQFPDINDGRVFPSTFDRRHDISFVFTYQFNLKWSIGGTFVYATGNTTTIPTSFYLNEGRVVAEFANRNNFRVPAYHRADLGVTYSRIPKNINRKYRSQWTFSVYNLYARANPFSYFVDVQSNNNTAIPSINLVPTQLSLLPFIIPAFIWNFSF